MNNSRSYLFSSLLAWLCLALAGCQGISLPADGRPASRPANASHTYFVYLPGMGGWLVTDTDWARAIYNTGIADHVELYDWPPPYFLISAVQAYDHNHVAAQYLADCITAKLREDPGARIVLAGWSAGAALVVWALEDLPDNLQVQSVLLIQPAINPDHDLTRALRHVRGHLFSTQSGGDWLVLGIGTLLFGTADDGVHTASAGHVGFREPAGCDRAIYRKLVPVPFDPHWLAYGNFGEHVGPMSEEMAKQVWVPMLIADRDGKTR